MGSRSVSLPLIALAAAAAATPACSTIATVFLPHRLTADTPNLPRVYSGTAANVAYLRGAGVEKELIALDLPFSLAADTLLLPFTIVAQLMWGNLEPHARAAEADSESRDQPNGA